MLFPTHVQTLSQDIMSRKNQTHWCLIPTLDQDLKHSGASIPQPPQALASAPRLVLPPPPPPKPSSTPSSPAETEPGRNQLGGPVPCLEGIMARNSTCASASQPGHVPAPPSAPAAARHRSLVTLSRQT